MCTLQLATTSEGVWIREVLCSYVTVTLSPQVFEVPGGGDKEEGEEEEEGEEGIVEVDISEMDTTQLLGNELTSQS